MNEIEWRHGNEGRKRCLVAWWGALERGGETVGDLRALQIVTQLLCDEGLEVSIATSVVYRELEAFQCVRWDAVDPASIDIFAFVCGPVIGDSPSFQSLHARFETSLTIALGVSVLPKTSSSAWNPFARIVARDDGDKAVHGDLAVFRRCQPKLTLPVRRVGLCLRGAQREYGCGASLHEQAERAAKMVLERLGGEVVELDTRLHGNPMLGDEIEASFESVDIVITSRMHGALLGIAKGKPTLAIDQIRSGAKVTSVISQLGWPAVIKADAPDHEIQALASFLLSPLAVQQLAVVQDSAATLHFKTCQTIRQEIRHILGRANSR